MASATLVREDIDAGLTLIRALDEAGYGTVAALWLYNSDTETWRMTIAYDGPRADLQSKYLQAAEISADWRGKHPDQPILDLSKVRITSADDKLISALRPVVRLEGVGEVRFSQNVVDGIFVEDALLHRVAA